MLALAIFVLALAAPLSRPRPSRIQAGMNGEAKRARPRGVHISSRAISAVCVRRNISASPDVPVSVSVSENACGVAVSS